MTRTSIPEHTRDTTAAAAAAAVEEAAAGHQHAVRGKQSVGGGGEHTEADRDTCTCTQQQFIPEHTRDRQMHTDIQR